MHYNQINWYIYFNRNCGEGFRKRWGNCEKIAVAIGGDLRYRGDFTITTIQVQCYYTGFAVQATHMVRIREIGGTAEKKKFHNTARNNSFDIWKETAFFPDRAFRRGFLIFIQINQFDLKYETYARLISLMIAL